MNTMHKETDKDKWMPFDDWLKEMGIRRTAGWSWRRRGAVRAINIFGRLYITAKEIERFKKRAEAGEFQRKKRFKKR